MNQSRKLKKEIGERVKNERLYKGLSRGDLASEIHASTDTVRKWEDGINMIPVDRIHDISEAVSSPAFQMLGFDDDNIRHRHSILDMPTRNQTQNSKKNNMIKQ